MREFIRHPSDVPIEICSDAAVDFTKETLKDIGHGGLCISSPGPLAIGLRLKLRIPVRDPVFEASGIVAWCRQSARQYDVGVQFEDPDTEFQMRMVEQICHIEQYRIQVLKQEGRHLDSKEAAFEWIQHQAEAFPR